MSGEEKTSEWSLPWSSVRAPPGSQRHWNSPAGTCTADPRAPAGPREPSAGNCADRGDHAADQPLGRQAGRATPSGFDCEHVMSIRSCLPAPQMRGPLPFPGHVWACAQDHLEAILGRRTTAAEAQLGYGAELVGLRLRPTGQFSPPSPLRRALPPRSGHGMSSAPTVRTARCAKRPGSPPPGPAHSATGSTSCSARRCATAPIIDPAWSTASATHPPAA